MNIVFDRAGDLSKIPVALDKYSIQMQCIYVNLHAQCRQRRAEGFARVFTWFVN